MDCWVLLSEHLEMTAHFKISAYFVITVTKDPVLNASCPVDKSLLDSELRCMGSSSQFSVTACHGETLWR